MRIPQKLRFVPPIILFGLTNLLVSIYIKYLLYVLYYYSRFVALGIFISLFSFSLMVWYISFVLILFGNPGEPKKEKEKYTEKDLPICMHCKQIRPYRTHHCSTCKCCYAKLDHHCKALGRCIALRNHKIFIDFLGHSLLMIFYWFCTVLYIYITFKQENMPSFLHFHIFATVSLFILVGILFYEQISNILTGKTTLELLYKLKLDIKKTKYERVEEVMGPLSILWILPTPTPETTSAYEWEYLRPPEEEVSYIKNMRETAKNEEGKISSE